MTTKSQPLHKPYTLEFRERLLARFLRYAAVGTPSDRHSADTKTPSTDSQWELIRLLEGELKEIGVPEVDVDERGFLVARLPSNLPAGRSVPCIGFIAHVDTASDVPGLEVKPLVHRDYEGGALRLPAGGVLDPGDNPELSRYRGDTVITSDGSTLLGADDKAGVAAIVSAAEYLAAHPEIPHGEIEIIFTPDEETGKGMDRFPLDRVRSKIAYTLDGDGEGTVESECFNAYFIKAVFKGIVFHVGHARGKLVNAVSMAARFITLLPQNESPEATDGRFGYYCPMEIKGNLEEASLEIYLRDFNAGEIRRRIDAVHAYAKAVEAAYPGGKIEVTSEKQYINMRDFFRDDPRIVGYLEEAVRASGIEPVYKSIRGGTDGARLSEKGIPTPNIFAGGMNFHSRTEWVALSAMTRAAEVVVNLARIWAEKG
jgi:tripeptide aminopeptidase